MSNPWDRDQQSPHEDKQHQERIQRLRELKEKTQQQIDDIYKIKSRAICIFKNYPMMIMHEKGIEIL